MSEPERYAPRGNIVWAMQYSPSEPLEMLNWLLRSKIPMFDYDDDMAEWPDQGVSFNADNEVIVCVDGLSKYLQPCDWVTLDITGDEPKIAFYGDALFQRRYRNVSLPNMRAVFSEQGVIL